MAFDGRRRRQSWLSKTPGERVDFMLRAQIALAQALSVEIFAARPRRGCAGGRDRRGRHRMTNGAKNEKHEHRARKSAYASNGFTTTSLV